MSRSVVPAEGPELLPLRGVNEFVYCPRLFFFEHVERQFEESHDTVDGDRVHHRVDEAHGALQDELTAADVTSVELSPYSPDECAKYAALLR